jgi:hypothetical protein
MDTETLTLAVTAANEATEPGTDAFRLKNPGMLCDGTRVRSFGHLIDGMRALMADIEKLDKTASITVGITRYCGKSVEMEFAVLDYISRATGKEVNRETLIGEI